MPRTSITNSQIAKLKKQLAMLEKKEADLKSKKQDKALAQIVKLIKDNAIDVADVKAALGSGAKAKRGRKAGQAAKKSTGDKRAKVAPKYRNPANQSETWTGRGKMPKWCADMKAAGTLESALIAN